MTDVTARVNLIKGNYARRNQVGVAYKMTGEFAHSATQVFTTYNNMNNIVSPDYTIADKDIIPDPVSVNPFVPGNRVMAQPRHYTVWMWPDSIAVPEGLQNVVLYPTSPEDAGDTPRWNVALRNYHMQPGFTAIAARPTITAVSAKTLRPVRCNLVRAGAVASQIASFFIHAQKYGPIEPSPEPSTGNKIYFTRFPAAMFVGLDGYPGVLPYGCANYLSATVPLDQISVTTMHSVPTFFNNDLVTRRTVMQDYPIRYQSITQAYFTLNGPLYRSLWVNTNDAKYTANGEWVTVWLPSEPRLPAAQERAVRAMAAARDYNVIQLAPKALGPVGRQMPDGQIVLRQKGISPNFGYSNRNTPCFSETNDYRTWSSQTSPEFFEEYASSPANNGPYYLDGYKTTFADFMGGGSSRN